MFEKVKIRTTKETVDSHVAGKIGRVYGETIPSSSGVEGVIGEHNDYAVSVHIEDLDEEFWFAQDLLEYLDKGEGTVVKIGNKTYKIDKNGEVIDTSKHGEVIDIFKNRH